MLVFWVFFLLPLYDTLDQMQGVDGSIVVLCVWWRVWCVVAFFFFFNSIVKLLSQKQGTIKLSKSINQSKFSSFLRDNVGTPITWELILQWYKVIGVIDDSQSGFHLWLAAVRHKATMDSDSEVNFSLYISNDEVFHPDMPVAWWLTACYWYNKRISQSAGLYHRRLEMPDPPI